jgi:hypothetical protein
MLRDLLATGSTTVLEIYFVLKRARIEWMRFDHGKFPHHVYTSEDDQAKDYAQARIQELMLTRLRDAQAELATMEMSEGARKLVERLLGECKEYVGKRGDEPTARFY